MSDQSVHPLVDRLSRRKMLAGLGALAGAGVVIGSAPIPAGAAPPDPITIKRLEALGTPISALTYLNIDAQAFWPTLGMAPVANSTAQRIYQDATGSQPAQVNSRLFAPLPIPVGSVIFEVSAAYQGQPILEISRRPLFSTGAPGTAPVTDFQQSFPASPGGALASTVLLQSPIVLADDSTYTVSGFFTAGASIFGVRIGYLPPTAGFFPFSGATPRILDTRQPGQTKFAINEQRKINLGVPGAASGVFNLTVDQTEGSGFLSAFAGDTFPGNSSLNFDHAGQIVANLVIAPLDDAGNVTIRCGVNRTHVIIDRIGFFI